jgi:hypothetical protein
MRPLRCNLLKLNLKQLKSVLIMKRKFKHIKQWWSLVNNTTETCSHVIETCTNFLHLKWLFYSPHCRLRSDWDPIFKSVLDPIRWFNAATFVCLYPARTRISMIYSRYTCISKKKNQCVYLNIYTHFSKSNSFSWIKTHSETKAHRSIYTEMVQSYSYFF